MRLLIVEASPRDNHSISRNLTRRFVAQWRSAHPDGEIVERNLMQTELPFVNAPWLQAYFTPPERHSAEMKAILRLSDELVGELLATNHVVIATPVYNYNVPAALKAWIDHIVRKGMTLGMDGKGLVTDTKATVLLASGGVYKEGSPIRDRDIATQYLRLILNVIGITDVMFVAAGNAKSVDMGETGMEAFIDRFQAEIEARAACTAQRPAVRPPYLLGGIGPASKKVPFLTNVRTPVSQPRSGPAEIPLTGHTASDPSRLPGRPSALPQSGHSLCPP